MAKRVFLFSGRTNISTGLVDSKKMKIKKNSKHFWFFCCIVTEDEIITCKSDFVSSLCVYYLRAALEVLLIISVQLDRGKECSLYNVIHVCRC